LRRELRLALIDAVTTAIIDKADELTRLDQVVGDGDHGDNMRRGCAAVALRRDELADMGVPNALHEVGTTLVSTVGGASGPLFGSLLIAMGKARREGQSWVDALYEGVEALKRRGKAEPGGKTMLDVLAPMLHCMMAGATIEEVRRAACDGWESTRGMVATRGKASSLGEGAVGHADPGATSMLYAVEAVCEVLAAAPPPGDVALVLVSHSASVAAAVAEMIRQLSGEEVRLAHSGGDGSGALGTDIHRIAAAIEEVWTEAGVVVLFDLGGAMRAAEIAIESLPQELGHNVRICKAALVEGAIVAAAEAVSGAPLDAVCAAAEAFRK
jgi:dihydroxyacetone kinase phosphoprotein-dependent L subunit